MVVLPFLTQYPICASGLPYPILLHYLPGCIEKVCFLRWRKFLMQTASVKWIGEQKFLGTSPSGHAVAFDSDRESNKAPGPMEMLLMALGACTATDMVIILEKKRQKIALLEVLCSGERAPEPPTVWTRLDVLFRIRGDVEASAVKHAMDLTKEKYCSVAAMLKQTAAFTWRYELLHGEGK
jgi:putative redox protein